VAIMESEDLTCTEVKTGFLPKETNANWFFWDSHWLEIWKNHLCPCMGPNMYRERGYRLWSRHEVHTEVGDREGILLQIAGWSKVV
jgi:hypothetical protein